MGPFLPVLARRHWPPRQSVLPSLRVWNAAGGENEKRPEPDWLRADLRPWFHLNFPRGGTLFPVTWGWTAGHCPPRGSRAPSPPSPGRARTFRPLSWPGTRGYSSRSWPVLPLYHVFRRLSRGRCGCLGKSILRRSRSAQGHGTTGTNAKKPRAPARGLAFDRKTIYRKRASRALCP